jgi:hyperosmotically inducible periplasmic protein
MKQMNLKLSWFSIFICLLGFFQLQSCKGKNRDTEINTAIQSKIQTDANLTGVNATVADGVVTLAGQCADENCKTNAENAIKDIDGVKKVVNNITVAPVTINPDQELSSGVQRITARYEGVQGEVNDGVITLRGQLKRDSLQQLMMDLNALRPKKIDNQLVLK